MANVSFQIDDERLEELDQIINIKKAKGELEGNTSRSDVLREIVQEYIEGNAISPTSSVEVVATAD